MVTKCQDGLVDPDAGFGSTNKDFFKTKTETETKTETAWLGVTETMA